MAIIIGTTGNDNLDGTASRDIFDARDGDDTVNGRNGRDLVFGGGGTDVISGGSGIDTLFGSGGNDSLFGGNGADRLTGGSGDDLLSGNGGNDIIEGGTGRDTVVFDANFGGADVVNLGFGDDTVNVGASTGQIRLTFTSSEVGNGNAFDSNSMANQDGGLAVRLQREDGSGDLTGSVSRFDDEGITFTAPAGVTFDVRDLVSGAARGDQFQNVVLATNANNRISEAGESQTYYINAGMGDDTLTGGRSNDFLVGGAGNDVLSGGRGNDAYIGGGGNDVVSDIGGDDRAIVNISTDGADSINLGVGSDVVSVSAAVPGQVRVTFTSSEVGNGSAVDTNTLANQDGDLAVRLQAEDGSDNLTGTIGRLDDEGISYVASAGVTFDVRDLVSGTARGDQFDVVTLGTEAGNRISKAGASQNYYINAGMGADSVVGGDGNDFLVGGAGDDALGGGTGDDSILGGGGNDTITGSAGDDRAIINITTDGSDSVNLGNGTDVVAVSAAVAGQVRLTFTSSEVGNGAAVDSSSMSNQDGGLAVRMQAEAGLLDLLAGPVSRFDDEGVSYVAGTGITFDVRDLVSGTQRGDDFQVVTLGTAFANGINQTGSSLAYYINAGMGNDSVKGGLADDFLVGGAGDDVLSGGFGADSFIGGGGADRFAFRFLAESDTAVDGRDSILDFSAAAGDRIDLSQIDAVAGGADDPFFFVGSFTSAAGEVTVVDIGGGQFRVDADVDGDASADLAIVVTSGAAITAADFIL